MTKYFQHGGGTIWEAMDRVVEVADKAALVAQMRSEVAHFYPEDEMPTLENTEIKPYAFDNRINWNTHLVTVKGKAWGYTDGPL